MSQPVPSVSIGLPIYNGERYLATALDSLLAQTFRDFELIIADNASTDETEAICRDYAARDNRIRYLRNARNLGAAGNFNYVLRLARAAYFKWAAYDDVCAPEFLARCVAVLAAHPEIVLVYPQTLLIDAQGAPVRLYPEDLDLRSSDRIGRYRRFHEHYRVGALCNAQYGVFRTAVLRRTPGIAAYANSDLVLIGELALRGPFYEVPEPLFWRREHPGMTVQAFATMAGRTAYLDPTQRQKSGHPYLRMAREHLAAVWRVPMPPGERLRCTLLVGRFVFWKAQIFLNDRLPSAAQSQITGVQSEK